MERHVCEENPRFPWGFPGESFRVVVVKGWWMMFLSLKAGKEVEKRRNLWSPKLCNYVLIFLLLLLLSFLWTAVFAYCRCLHCRRLWCFIYTGQTVYSWNSRVYAYTYFVIRDTLPMMFPAAWWCRRHKIHKIAQLALHLFFATDTHDMNHICY